MNSSSSTLLSVQQSTQRIGPTQTALLNSLVPQASEKRRGWRRGAKSCFSCSDYSCTLKYEFSFFLLIFKWFLKNFNYWVNFLKAVTESALKGTQKANKYYFLQYILVKKKRCFVLFLLLCFGFFFFFFGQMNASLDDTQSYFSHLLTALFWQVSKHFCPSFPNDTKQHKL